jgi:hypothetical protein
VSEINLSNDAFSNNALPHTVATGDLGYKGSMRPGYEGKMTLKDVHEVLVEYEGGDVDPFAKYGSGMRKW